MPLISKTLTEEGCTLVLWRMDETTEELKGFQFSKNSWLANAGDRHPLRLRQKLSTRALLHELDPENPIEVRKDFDGRPWPVNKPGFISITHNSEFVAALYHPSRPCGIDIEQPSERILKIANRFVHPVENEQIRTNDIVQDTTLIWCIKECMFKQLGRKGVAFRDHLRVGLMNSQGEYSNQGIAMDLLQDPPVRIHYHWRRLDNLILVHTIA